MPIGTVITASRNGRVIAAVENYSDNDLEWGKENLIIIDHGDSTYSRYLHLTRDGALVEINQIVSRGDTIGLSGNSGLCYLPHLHFDVTSGSSTRDAQTIPVFFKNTTPHPNGLIQGVSYTAEPY